MSNYTTAQKDVALRMLEQGKSIAEIQGFLAARYTGVENPNQYAGQELDMDDYLDGAARGHDAREKLAARGI